MDSSNDDVRRYFAPGLTQDERAVLYDLLRDVDAALEGREYFVYGGGLLGQVIFGDIQPWEDDVDILVVGGIEAKDINLPHRGIFQAQLLKVYDKSRPLMRGRRYSFPFVDIGSATDAGDEITHASVYGGVDRFPADLIFPLRRAKLGPVEVYIPNQPEAVCKLKYGPHCLTHARPPQWDHRHERRTGYPQERIPLEQIV